MIGEAATELTPSKLLREHSSAHRRNLERPTELEPGKKGRAKEESLANGVVGRGEVAAGSGMATGGLGWCGVPRKGRGEAHTSRPIAHWGGSSGEDEKRGQRVGPLFHQRRRDGIAREDNIG